MWAKILETKKKEVMLLYKIKMLNRTFELIEDKEEAINIIKFRNNVLKDVLWTYEKAEPEEIIYCKKIEKKTTKDHIMCPIGLLENIRQGNVCSTNICQECPFKEVRE